MIDVTGGGLRNFLRLRHGVGISIDEPMPVPPVFEVLGDLGSVEPSEMYQTFNMGMGFALVLPPDEARRAVSIYGQGARIVGRVVEGGGVSVPSLGLRYEKY
jgi:phosphoribosylformylglycinamidine cyclo-ligase